MANTSVLGMDAAVYTAPIVTVVRGYYGTAIPTAITIGSASVDAGNTPTTMLRAGLILAKKTSDGKYYPATATATDGTQNAELILAESVNMLDANGTAQDRASAEVYSGGVFSGSSLPSGSGAGCFTTLTRRQLEGTGKFQFDDDNLNAGKGIVQRAAYEVTKTAAYTIVAGDNGTRFDNTGATASATLTLPAIAAGYEFLVRANANQALIVASPEGSNIIAKNNLTASNLAYSTSGQIIGGTLSIKSNMAGTKWEATNLSGDCTLSVY